MLKFEIKTHSVVLEAETEVSSLLLMKCMYLLLLVHVLLIYLSCIYGLLLSFSPLTPGKGRVGNTLKCVFMCKYIYTYVYTCIYTYTQKITQKLFF